MVLFYAYQSITSTKAFKDQGYMRKRVNIERDKIAQMKLPVNLPLTSDDQMCYSTIY